MMIPQKLEAQSSLSKEDQAQCDANVRKFFKTAMRNDDVVRAAITISSRLGFDGPNTLFSHSCCPDEINHEEGDITHALQTHFGEIFSLGGLAGIPFSGKTGFGAYAAHVPD